MAYRGSKAHIPLGLLGLRTDDAQNRTDPRNLISSKNIFFVDGVLEKAPGARNWNTFTGTVITKTFTDSDIDAGTDAITITSHGFTNETKVTIYSSGNMPAGLSSGGTYWITTATTHTFKLSTTPGGSTIDLTTAAGTGTHTITNVSAILPNGVAAFTDYYPDDEVKRVVAVAKNGKVYRFIDPTNRSEVTASGSAPATLTLNGQVHIAQGGIETQNRSRKLFIFSGKDPVQVISGDNLTRANISTPASDWSGTNQPKFGLIYRGRLGVFGNSNAPHRFYLSDPSDHEDFAGAGLITLNVFPGEGEALSGAFVFKGRLFFFKRPSGLYYLDDSDTSAANWVIAKVNQDFGAASIHSFTQILDDFLVKNQTGSLTSLAATFKFGDLESADLLGDLRCENFFREFTSTDGNESTECMYYQDKKQAFYTYFANSGTKNNRILALDYNSETPKISLWDFAQANCFALVKDIKGNQRPFFGADDGYIYRLDQSDRSLNTIGTKTAYTFEAQTPHMDFGFMDGKIASQQKFFDHLELVFRPSGDWNLSVGVYIDGELYETLSYSQLRNRGLGAFLLGEDKLEGSNTKSLLKPLHGSGRTLSLKLYNSGTDQNVKIESLVVYFRVGNNKQQVDQRT